MSILQGIKDINGVTGCALFDAHDQCVEHLMPPPYEPILLGHVMTELRSALEMMGSVDDAREWSTLQLIGDEGCMVLRQIEGGGTLMALGSLTLNLSLLSVGFNVTSMKITQNRSGSQSRSGVGSHQSQLSGLSRPQVSSLTPSGGGGVHLPGAVGQEVVDKLLKLLAKHIGPFAKLAVKEEMKRMGVGPNQMMPGQYDDLVVMVARRIDNTATQKSFVSEARGLLVR